MEPASPRYSRQIPVIGEEGQERLARSAVAVAGLGGLGSIVSMYLAAAGVGRIILVDGGLVDEPDLNRQLLYTVKDLGRPKAEAAAERLRLLNPLVEIEAHAEKLTSRNVEELLGNADVIVDCLDNWETRHILNKYAVEAGKPLVHGAVEGLYGQVLTIMPGKGPCLSCIFPRTPEKRGEIPVLGPVAGIVASLQALEAIKLVTSVGEPLIGRLVIVDGYRSILDEVRVERNPSCPVCGGKP